MSAHGSSYIEDAINANIPVISLFPQFLKT
jgi:hypothetical protein